MELKNILENESFVKELNESIEIIIKDNKIDEFDIPEIVFVITNIINSQPKIKLDRNNLKDLIMELFDYIVREKINDKNEMTQEQIDNFNKLIESSIKLVLLKPNYSKINRCLNRILYCK